MRGACQGTIGSENTPTKQGETPFLPLNLAERSVMLNFMKEGLLNLCGCHERSVGFIANDDFACEKSGAFDGPILPQEPGLKRSSVQKRIDHPIWPVIINLVSSSLHFHFYRGLLGRSLVVTVPASLSVCLETLLSDFPDRLCLIHLFPWISY